MVLLLLFFFFRELTDIYSKKTGSTHCVTNHTYLNLMRLIVQLSNERRVQIQLICEKFNRALMGLMYAAKQVLYIIFKQAMYC